MLNRLIYLIKYYVYIISNRLRTLDYIEFHISDHCNLNCAYCTHFSPLAEPAFYEFENFKKDIIQLSKLTNSYIKDIRILGGEPLLNERCTEYIEITRKFFPASKISLVTNGILLSKQSMEFWKCCRENKILIDCSRYPINLDYSQIEQLCKDNNVGFYFNGNNTNSRYFLKVALDKDGKVPFEKSYLICNCMSKCAFLRDGRIYHCPIIGNIEILNKYFNEKFILSDKDSINIHKISKVDRILKFLSKDSPFCRYCNLSESHCCSWKKSAKSIDEWVKN